MASNAWKRHERLTAQYFGTKRRLRGHDFSVSDVEVLVDTNEWLSHADPEGPLIIVECKYSKNMGIVTEYKKCCKDSEVSNPMMRIGDYIIGDLETFKEFYVNFVDPKINTSNDVNDSRGLNFIDSTKKLPKYINDYYEQAKNYSIEQETEKFILSMVCVTKAHLQGRFFVINLREIEKYWRQYKEKSTF